MTKRSSDDERWISLREKVHKRDKGCRLMKILSAKEFLTLQRIAPKIQLSRLDVAHCFGVGPFPHMCYNQKNVLLLNRFSHENLDNCKSPVTGERISLEDRDAWWIRLLGENLFLKLKEESFNHTPIELEEDIPNESKI